MSRKKVRRTLVSHLVAAKEGPPEFSVRLGTHACERSDGVLAGADIVDMGAHLLVSLGADSFVVRVEAHEGKQLSIRSDILEACKASSWIGELVTLKKLKEEDLASYRLQQVVISFGGRFISQREVMLYQKQLQSARSVVYINGLAPNREELHSGLIMSMDTGRAFGIVDLKTNLIFRPNNPHTFYMLEASKELFELQSDGKPYLEAVMDLIRRILLDNTDPILTIVIFGRFHVKGETQDFFEVIFDEPRCRLTDANLLISHIRAVIMGFPKPGAQGLTSEYQNVLEAVNLVFDHFRMHNTDRNLEISGHHLVILTAGFGVINLTRTKIASTLLTTTCLRFQALGMYSYMLTLISVRARPYHKTPLVILPKALADDSEVSSASQLFLWGDEEVQPSAREFPTIFSESSSLCYHLTMFISAFTKEEDDSLLYALSSLTTSPSPAPQTPSANAGLKIPKPMYKSMQAKSMVTLRTQDLSSPDEVEEEGIPSAIWRFRRNRFLKNRFLKKNSCSLRNLRSVEPVATNFLEHVSNPFSKSSLKALKSPNSNLCLEEVLTMFPRMPPVYLHTDIVTRTALELSSHVGKDCDRLFNDLLGIRLSLDSRIIVTKTQFSNSQSVLVANYDSVWKIEVNHALKNVSLQRYDQRDRLAEDCGGGQMVYPYTYFLKRSCYNSVASSLNHVMCHTYDWVPTHRFLHIRQAYPWKDLDNILGSMLDMPVTNPLWVRQAPRNSQFRQVVRSVTYVILPEFVDQSALVVETSGKTLEIPQDSTCELREDYEQLLASLARFGKVEDMGASLRLKILAGAVMDSPRNPDDLFYVSFDPPSWAPNIMRISIEWLCNESAVLHRFVEVLISLALKRGLHLVQLPLGQAFPPPAASHLSSWGDHAQTTDLPFFPRIPFSVSGGSKLELVRRLLGPPFNFILLVSSIDGTLLFHTQGLALVRIGSETLIWEDCKLERDNLLLSPRTGLQAAESTVLYREVQELLRDPGTSFGD